MSENSLVKFLQGEDFNSDVPFLPGAVYFDKKNKQIWFDDPTSTNLTHTRLTSLPSYTEVTSLPGTNAGYKHNDIIVVKTKVTDTEYSFVPYVFNEDTKTWQGLNNGHSAEQIYIDYATALSFNTKELVV